MELRPVIARIADGERLDAATAEAAFGAALSGEANAAEIAAMLMGLRVRGETAAELEGAVRAIRARMRAIPGPEDAIDLCGTGGDGQATLNISTACAFVVAGAGLPVAKHGNKAISSRSGAADVLAALGIDPDPPVETQARALAELGIAFLFAPRHHAALRHAAEARRALGTRSLLNLAGPLCNPAGSRLQLIGVYDRRWLEPMAETLRALGSARAWLVHGAGLDELTLAGESDVVTLAPDGTIARITVTPEDAGLARAPVSSVAGGDPVQNASALGALLEGARGPYRDIVLLNAAAALVVGGRASDLREGVSLASRALDEGAALNALERLRRYVPFVPSREDATHG